MIGEHFVTHIKVPAGIPLTTRIRISSLWFDDSPGRKQIQVADKMHSVGHQKGQVVDETIFLEDGRHGG